jgi:hypothetical protein
MVCCQQALSRGQAAPHPSCAWSVAWANARRRKNVGMSFDALKNHLDRGRALVRIHPDHHGAHPLLLPTGCDGLARTAPLLQAEQTPLEPLLAHGTRPAQAM